jgi:copper chaperone CopZ
MVCSKCSDRVAAALAKVDGVTAASADHTAGTARAQVAPGVTGAALAAVVTGIGFEATAE